MTTPKEKATKIISLLKKKYPNAHCELNFSNPLELLIATILSAQCTDKRVNEVTKTLFKKYKKATDYVGVPAEELEQDIRSTGFYKNKAKAIQGCCKALTEKYDGKIPKNLDELVALPGIGRKTANLVLGHTYGIPGIVTDTHVIRVSQRLGFTKNKDPEKIEYDLQKLIPEKEWTFVSDVLIFHGRYCCYAKKPNCPECPVLKLCPYEPKTTI
jgi:endonuclease-3